MSHASACLSLSYSRDAAKNARCNHVIMNNIINHDFRFVTKVEVVHVDVVQVVVDAAVAIERVHPELVHVHVVIVAVGMVQKVGHRETDENKGKDAIKETGRNQSVRENGIHSTAIPPTDIELVCLWRVLLLTHKSLCRNGKKDGKLKMHANLAIQFEYQYIFGCGLQMRSSSSFRGLESR
jgi:hypothetical protein